MNFVVLLGFVFFDKDGVIVEFSSACPFGALQGFDKDREATVSSYPLSR